MGKFSENLRVFMARMGLNQVELAKKADIKVQLVNSYLNESRHAKHPSLKTLVKLAAALNVTVDELTGESPKTSPEELEFQKTVAANLRRIMEDKKLSQSALAKLTGISQSTISRYINVDETGIIPRLYNLVLLARALNVSMANLTGDSRHRKAEEHARKLSNLTSEHRQILEAYESLPENDPKRKAIDALLLGLKSGD